MKNKDKYDLTKLSVHELFQVNGCGKKIPSSREVQIMSKGETIAKIKTQESLLYTLMRWLEQED